jgi:hypothetical protein
MTLPTKAKIAMPNKILLPEFTAQSSHVDTILSVGNGLYILLSVRKLPILWANHHQNGKFIGLVIKVATKVVGMLALKRIATNTAKII